MKTTQFKSLIKEVVNEIGYEPRNVQLYRWIQMRLKSRGTRPDEIDALKKVAAMIEREAGDVLSRETPIRGGN